jgi:hypothetical protein
MLKQGERPCAISQVADRIDGKATAELQTEQRHRYVIEAPAQLTPRAMDCEVLADARGDPGVSANDYSIAWSARGNARAHARRLQRQAQRNQVVPQHDVSSRARRLVGAVVRARNTFGLVPSFRNFWEL